MEVLNDTKSRSKDVKMTLVISEQKTQEINNKREQYRPVAIRGSVLYFCIIEMIQIKWMYNTSLQQFLEIFDFSIDMAEKGNTQERVKNILMTATYIVYMYVNRGLYEDDKTTFLLLICFKKLITDNKLKADDISIFLKGGADLDPKSET
jgi:dynein heavy chain